MKKFLTVALLIFVLSSCGGDSADVTKAKQDLGVIAGGSDNSPMITQEEVLTVDLEEDFNEKADVLSIDSGDTLSNTNDSRDPRIQLNYLSGERMIELNDLVYSEFKAGYSKITGKTLGNIDKIMVTFSNEESDFPNDSFVLQQFASGDDTFEYNASSRFKVLDFGLNKYEITAYHDGGESLLELLVMVSENDDRTIENASFNPKVTQIEEVSLKNTDFDIDNLPEGEGFGNVISLGEDSFTYSDIKGLEVSTRVVGNISCGVDENGEYPLSNYLGDTQKSWFYWNTCRDIVAGKGINFFVVRLDGDEYVYEKHYVDTNHGLYATYELERGIGVTQDTIAEKNTELKLKNADFTQLSVVDSLFRKIVE